MEKKKKQLNPRQLGQTVTALLLTLTVKYPRDVFSAHSCSLLFTLITGFHDATDVRTRKRPHFKFHFVMFRV